MRKWFSLLSSDKEITISVCFGVKANHLPVAAESSKGQRMDRSLFYYIVVNVKISYKRVPLQACDAHTAAKHDMLSFPLGSRETKAATWQASKSSQRTCALQQHLPFSGSLTWWHGPRDLNPGSSPQLSHQPPTSNPMYLLRRSLRPLKFHQDVSITPHIRFLQL